MEREAVVVTIAAVSISSPFGPIQLSHSPANATGPPPLRRTKYGCLRVPYRSHSKKPSAGNRQRRYFMAFLNAGLSSTDSPRALMIA